MVWFRVFFIEVLKSGREKKRAGEKEGDRKRGRQKKRATEKAAGSDTEHYERDREERRAGSFAFSAVI